MTRLVWTDPNPPGVARTYIVYRYEGADKPLRVLAETTETFWPLSLPPGAHRLYVAIRTTDGLESAPSDSLSFVMMLAPIELRLEVS